MTAVRSLLVDRHSWFFHVSATKSFEQIKCEGIKPHNPGCAAPDVVRGLLGDSADKIVCLTPQGTVYETTSCQPRFRMAVAREDLPPNIGLDWSYDTVWALPAIILKDEPEKSKEEIFYDIVRRRGSVVSYAPLLPSVLRVRSKTACEHMPSDWPKLQDITLDDLHIV